MGQFRGGTSHPTTKARNSDFIFQPEDFEISVKISNHLYEMSGSVGPSRVGKTLVFCEFD